jgi:aldehyde:ferredoxin oxidoreductase
VWCKHPTLNYPEVIKELSNLFEEYFKKEIVKSNYRCNDCGYQQGHQLIYCSKYPGKMVHIKNESEWENLKYNTKWKEQLYYKWELDKISKSILKGDYLSSDIWESNKKEIDSRLK